MCWCMMSIVANLLETHNIADNHVGARPPWCVLLPQGGVDQQMVQAVTRMLQHNCQLRKHAQGYFGMSLKFKS